MIVGLGLLHSPWGLDVDCFVFSLQLKVKFAILAEAGLGVRLKPGRTHALQQIRNSA